MKLDYDSVIDRLSLFIDKLACSASMALKNQYILSAEHWNLVNVHPFAGSNQSVWKIYSAVEQCPPGHPARKLHPLSYMLTNRYTFSGDKGIDIERMLGFPEGLMTSAFLRGFRMSPTSSSALSLDRDNNTKAYSIMYNLGVCCTNILYHNAYNYAIPVPLEDALNKVFRGALVKKNG